MDLSLYGLLHLADDEKGSPNDTPADFQDQVRMYAYSALGLSRSLEAHRIAFTLLTNTKATIDHALGPDKTALHVEEIDFRSEIPSGIRFYSSHCKLDVYRFFASRANEYSVLCDLDMICINDFPQCFFNNVSDRVPMCYDISDQVIPAWGRDSIIYELECMLENPSEGRWTGGGFIGGPPEFFSLLGDEIASVFPKYVDNLDAFWHVGDEAPMSAALEKMRKSGRYIADAGTLGIVGVFWNCDVLHPQRPFEYFKQCSLLHLPADKRYLSDMARRGIWERSHFLEDYESRRNPSLVQRSRTQLQKTRGKVARRVNKHLGL